jgi:hypothetical protein
MVRAVQRTVPPESDDVSKLSKVHFPLLCRADLYQDFDRKLTLDDWNESRQVEIAAQTSVDGPPLRHQPGKGLLLVEAFCGTLRPANLSKCLDEFMNDLKRLRVERSKPSFTALQKEAFNLTVEALREREKRVLKLSRERMAKAEFKRKWGEGYVLHENPCRSSRL